MTKVHGYIYERAVLKPDVQAKLLKLESENFAYSSILVSRGEIRQGYWKLELKVNHCIGQTNRARFLHFGLGSLMGCTIDAPKIFWKFFLIFGFRIKLGN